MNLEEKVLEKFKKSKQSGVMERFAHSQRVAKKAVELAKMLQVNEEDAYTAGIIHDYLKFYTMDDFFNVVKECDVDNIVLENNYKILHSLLAPYVIKKELGIDDEDILNAVKYHTIGRANMSILEEIIFLADALEEGREGVDDIREVAKEDYKKAIAMVIDLKMNISIKKNASIHQNTLRAYESYRPYLEDDLTKLKRVIKTIDKNLIRNIRIYNMRKYSPLFDFIVVATADSMRQMEAVSNYLKDEFVVRGLEKADAWTLIDLNDIIINLFTGEERIKYGLDKLYHDLPPIFLDKNI